MFLSFPHGFSTSFDISCMFNYVYPRVVDESESPCCFVWKSATPIPMDIFWTFLWGGGGKGDVNVIVNLLTPCMLRDPQGLCGGDVNAIVNLLTPCMLRDPQSLCGGDVNAIVNLLTPCMLRETQGLGGGDVNAIVNLLTPCMLRDSQGLGGGDVNVIVNLLTPCMLRFVTLRVCVGGC